MSSDHLISIIDVMNIIGLLVVGITLLLGYAEKIGCWAGMALLLLYYLAQPPWPGVSPLAAEGNYFLVNKNLIELCALVVLLVFPTGNRLGLSRLQKLTR